MSSNNENHANGDESQDIPPGLIGLQNLGNTCYMNGALQALSNCQQLTRYLLDCPKIYKEKGLSHSYAELIRQMWEKSHDTQYAVPTNIISNFKRIYPAFRGCTQQDTQEFLRCFLEQLHDELKQPIREDICKSYIDCNGIGDKSSVSPSPGDKNNSNSDSSCDENSSEVSKRENNKINHRTNPIVNKNLSHRSIISDTFEFKISSSVVCSNCNNISTTKETFKDLSIPIPSRDHPYYQTANEDDIGSDGCTKTSRSSNDDIRSTEKRSSSRNESTTLRSHGSSQSLDACSVDSGHSRETDKLETVADINMNALQKTYNNYPILLASWFWNWLSSFSGWFWGPTVTLNDCLAVFFGTDPLEGDNEYSCDVCTKKNKGAKYLKILELPEVLCIHFKRYESVGSAKITTHVEFPLVGLDLSQYLSDDALPQCTTYNLIACICHHGSALLTGHYTTYAMNCFDEQWYEFDDQYVTNVDEKQVENCEAYILFYQKTTLDDRIDRRRNIASKLLKKSLFGEKFPTKVKQTPNRSTTTSSIHSSSETGQNEMDDQSSDERISTSDKTDYSKIGDNDEDDNVAPKQYFISKEWINRFNTFVEPGPITNCDFLCEHVKVPKSKQALVDQLCHVISEPVWEYLKGFHGGGPECCKIEACNECDI